MRDRNGTGNIYFVELFSDGIPLISWIFYTMQIWISIVNIVFSPFLFYTGCINRGYHKNLRLISSNLYLSIFILGIGNFFYAILILTRVNDINNDHIFGSFRFLAGLGSANYRATFMAIVLERTAATIFYKSYENNAPLILGIVLFLFGHTGVFLPIIYYIVKVSLITIIWSVASTNITCVVATIILFWTNKYMRKLNLNDVIALTQRYQLAENLHVMRILIPLITLATLFDITALIAYSVEVSIDFNTQLMYPLYLMITNIYGNSAIFLCIKNDKVVHKRIIGLFCKTSSANVEPVKEMIRDNNGQPLVIIETPDIHFNHLSQFWK